MKASGGSLEAEGPFITTFTTPSSLSMSPHVSFGRSNVFMMGGGWGWPAVRRGGRGAVCHFHSTVADLISRSSEERRLALGDYKQEEGGGGVDYTRNQPAKQYGFE